MVMVLFRQRDFGSNPVVVRSEVVAKPVQRRKTMSAIINEINNDNNDNASTGIDPVLQMQINKQQKQATESFECDILAWNVGAVDQQLLCLQLGWDIINMSANLGKQQVKGIIKKILDSAKALKKVKQNLSPATIYRRKGPLQRIIQARAGLDRPVTMPYLAKHLDLLLQLKREELPGLAKSFTTSQALAHAYPVKPGEKKTLNKKSPENGKADPPTKPAAPNVKPTATPAHPLIMPVVTAVTVMAQMAELHERNAILGMMLKEARLRSVQFGIGAINKMSYFKRASGQAVQECGKIIKFHQPKKEDGLAL